MNSKIKKSVTVLSAAVFLTVSGWASDVPGIGQENGISANQAAEMKVGPGGVIVDVKDGGVPMLPTVMYNGGAVVGGKSPSDFVGKKNVVLSIADVEMMALNYSWELKKTMTQRLEARARKYNAWGQGLPSASFNGSWSAHQSSTSGSRYANSAANQFGVGASIQQPLFLGGRVVAAIKEAALYEDFVSEDIQRVRLAVISTIRNQYYLCLRNMKNAEIYKEQMEIAKEYWEKTKRRYEADDVAEIDVLRYEVDYKIQKAYYIRWSNQYNVAVTDMLRLIGLPLDTEVTLSDPFQFAEYDPGSEKSLMEEALSTRPDLREQYIQEKINEEQLWQQKSQLFPELYANGSWSNTNDYSHSAERRTDVWNWSAGVSVQWNALAGAGQIVRASIINAEAALEKQKFTTRDTEDQVRQDVKDSLLNLYSSIDWVKSQEESVEQANRVLEQETIRWDEGAGDYLNILDARRKLADSQLLFWDGIYSYKIAIVNLDYSVGRFNSSYNSEVKGYSVSKPATKRMVKSKVDPQAALAESFGNLAMPVAAKNVDEAEKPESKPARIDAAMSGADKPAQQEITPPAGPAPLF